MGYVSENYMFVPAIQIVNSIGTFTMDSATLQLGAVFVAPKAGTISKIWWRTGGVTTSQSVNMGLQALDASGYPNGVFDQTSTRVTIAASTWYQETLNVGRVVTRGQQMAFVWQWAGAAGSIQVDVSGTIDDNLSYTTKFTGSSWTSKIGNNPMILLEYSDGSFNAMVSVMSAVVSVANYNNGTTNAAGGNERGLRFRLPFGCTVLGMRIRLAVVTGSNFDCVLYDSDGVTALGTASVTVANLVNTGNTLLYPRFASDIALLANTYYRLVIKATTINNIQPYYDDIPTVAAQMDSFPGGQDFHYTQRTSGSSWTDTLTRRPDISLMVNQFQVGSIIPVGMNGGIRG